MNTEYSKSKGPDWCAVIRIPTQTTWATIDAKKRQSRVAAILKDTFPRPENLPKHK